MRNRRPKSFVRGTALLLSLLLAVPLQASAVTIDEVQTRQEELAQENAQLEEKLATLKEDESAALEYQATLEEKIGVVEEKIDTARENIQLMDEEILVLEKKLDAAQEEYQETLDLFAQRVRALYKTGNADTLAVLLNSKSFSEFALKTEMMSAVARHDQEIVDQLTEYVDATQADRGGAAEAPGGSGPEQAGPGVLTRTSWKDLNAENEAVIADLVDQQLMVEDTIQQNESEDAELNATLEALLARSRPGSRRSAASRSWLPSRPPKRPSRPRRSRTPRRPPARRAPLRARTPAMARWTTAPATPPLTTPPLW